MSGSVVVSAFVVGPYYRDAAQRMWHEKFIKVVGLSGLACYALAWLLSV